MDTTSLIQGARFEILCLRGTKADIEKVVEETMDEADRKKFFALVQFTANQGPPRNEQKSRPVKSQSGIFELKPGRWRIPFFYQSQQIILTHAFPKEGSKAQDREFEYAARLRDQFLSEQERTNKTTDGKRGKSR